MKRLACFTPLPPSTSGIAQYSAELLPFLARDFALDAIIADDAPAPGPPPGIAVRRAGALPANEPYAARLYQLGNSPEHAYILDRAEREPGICVLHDVTLQHLQVWRALHGGPAAAASYRAEMAHRYGATGAAAADDVLHNRQPAILYAAIPLCERVVERSLATIVHSRYARDLVLSHCPAAEVAVVPHGVLLLPEGDRRAARDRLGLPRGAVIVAAVGNLIPEKRLEVALRAFARSLFGVREALFVVAGAPSPHYDPRAMARAHGLEPVTRWLGRIDAATFEAVLAAADLCVNLRWPTGGETSGSFLRMLAAGRPTIISAAGSFDETPDDACLKVPVGGEAEESAIVRSILRVAHDPAWAAALGRRARAFAAESHSFERAAAGYRAVIEAVAGESR
jgi:glycosyltransferase involved in cell wall biosynthesis